MNFDEPSPDIWIEMESGIVHTNYGEYCVLQKMYIKQKSQELKKSFYDFKLLPGSIL